MFLKSRFLSVAVLGGLGWFFLIAGCQKSSVDAVPRVSNAKPVFGNAGSGDDQKKSGDINFDCIHPDHFACLSFDVQKITSRQELQEVPWEILEEQLAELVGKANADLDLIQRIWLLLDREGLTSAMAGNTQKLSERLIVTVIQYRNDPNLERLAEARSLRGKSAGGVLEPTEPEGDKDEPAGKSVVDSKNEAMQPADQTEAPQSELVAESIGGRRIAIGTDSVVGKMKNFQTPAGNSGLRRFLTQLDFTSDVEGVIATGPVRETLKSVLGLAAQLGVEEAKEFKNLPEVLEQIEIRFSLAQDASEFLSVKAMVEDKPMIQQIVRQSQSAINAAGDKEPKSSTARRLIDRPRSQGEDPQEAAFRDVAEQVLSEIQEKNLFSVEGGDDSVTFRLGRPEKISELIEAMFSDVKPADLSNMRE